jgi:hypothetical protein
LEELFNLKYKDEVDIIKDEDDFESLGDEKYTFHEDMEARLYWAFCRPSGSSDAQVLDKHPLVSIMAFNHSRLPALKRFQLLNKEVIKDVELRKKIKNRTRMLFRDLVDNDFSELNEVLKIVPVFIDVAVDQLKNGRKWNDIVADDIEATIFYKDAKKFFCKDEALNKAFLEKLANFEEFEIDDLKKFLELKVSQKEQIDSVILEYYKEKTSEWIEQSNLHILQKKTLENLAKKL